MKCIIVTFDDIDASDIAIMELKKEFTFSYTIADASDKGITTNNFNFLFYGLQNYSFYSPSSFASPLYYPLINSYPSPDEESAIKAKTSPKTTLKIKCKNNIADTIYNRLINLNGREIVIV